MALIDRLLRRADPMRAGLVEIHESWRDGNEKLPVDFREYASDGYLRSGPIWACVTARMSVFSEVQFAYRDDEGDWFPPPQFLINPGAMLRRAIVHLDLAGNAYLYKANPQTVQLLRPDWVAVVTNDREVVGYVYEVGGVGTGGRTYSLFPDEVAHWTFNPDPMSPVLGQSWLTPVAREILADQKMQAHKGAFYRNGATPNIIFTFERVLSEEARKQITESLTRKYAGVENAYKNIVMDAAGGKVGVHTVGSDFQQLDFARVQDQGETRIASAAGVPPIVVGFSTGLQAATYSNYAQAVRRFVDGTIRPLWASFVQAVSPLAPPRTGMKLAYDDRRVPALQQDAKDDAEIENLKADTAATLIRAGYEPDSVTSAVTASKLELLTHTGNVPTALYNPEDIDTEQQPNDDDTEPATV